MYEQSKAAKRRVTQPAFLTRYFVGSGLDIGAGPDGLSRYVGVFPLLGSVRDWDLTDGDAQYLAGVADASMDFVHASHCLEHMRDPRVALAHWLRVVRPGGYVIVTVPDEDMYERGVWPSRRNADHKWTFTAAKRESWSPVSVSLIDLAREFADLAELERLEVLRDFFRPEDSSDQTMGPVAECAIEMVLRRTGEPAAARLGPAARSLIPPVGRLRLKGCRRGLMLFDPATPQGAVLDTHGEYADGTATALETMLRPGDVVATYGAGIGVFAVAMARRVGPGGRVHAMAEDAAGFRLLSANATLNEQDALLAAFPPVPPDGLELTTCRMIHVDAAAEPVWVLSGAAVTVANCQPLLVIEASEPARADLTLAAAGAIGYRAYWHVAPVAPGAGWFGGAAPLAVPPVASLILVPPATTLNGLPAATTADWRADTVRPPSAAPRRDA